MNKIFTVLLLFLMLPVVALAQSGQLRGTITDQETGEPLLGANVLVVGTTQGAATDINGEYVILNLFAATYEVRATYIGYQAQTIQNVRVVAGLTSELNFQLAAEGIQVGEVEVEQAYVEFDLSPWTVYHARTELRLTGNLSNQINLGGIINSQHVLLFHNIPDIGYIIDAVLFN